MSRTIAPALLLLAVCVGAFGAASASQVVEGNPSSPVRVLIYEDLQCPDCAAFRKMLDEKLAKATPEEKKAAEDKIKELHDKYDK